MMKPVLFTTPFFVLLLALVSDACRVSENDCYKKYAFDINLTCSPQKDTFRIGDTMWFESHINASLINRLDNSLANASNLKYRIYGNVVRYDEVVTNQPEHDFDFLPQQGNILIEPAGGPYARLKLVYDAGPDHTDDLKAGCIPRVAGLYAFAFYQDDAFGEGIVEKGCFEQIQLTYIMNGAGNDNNYHFIEGHPLIKDFEGFTRDGGYAFWVVE